MVRGESLRDDEEESRLARTRLPDLGFAEVAWRWARGERLARVLERAELAPGDFVRNAKQLVDLLRQLATVAPDPVTAASAHRAATALQRGVVAASAPPPVGTDDEGLDEGPVEGLDEVPDGARGGSREV